MSFTFDFEAYIYDFLLLLLVYGFGLAEKSLFSWEEIVGILVGGIGALETTWGNIIAEAIYKGITALEVVLECYISSPFIWKTHLCGTFLANN